MELHKLSQAQTWTEWKITLPIFSDQHAYVTIRFLQEGSLVKCTSYSFIETKWSKVFNELILSNIRSLQVDLPLYELLQHISLWFRNWEFKCLPNFEREKIVLCPRPRPFVPTLYSWLRCSTQHTALWMIVSMCGMAPFNSVPLATFQDCHVLVIKWIRDVIVCYPCHHFGVPYLLTQGQHLVATQYVFAEWINKQTMLLYRC